MWYGAPLEHNAISASSPHVCVFTCTIAPPNFRPLLLSEADSFLGQNLQNLRRGIYHQMRLDFPASALLPCRHPCHPLFSLDSEPFPRSYQGLGDNVRPDLRCSSLQRDRCPDQGTNHQCLPRLCSIFSAKHHSMSKAKSCSSVLVESGDNYSPPPIM